MIASKTFRDTTPTRSAPPIAPGSVATAKTIPLRKSTRRCRAYAIVPDEALKKTAVRLIAVSVCADSCG